MKKLITQPHIIFSTENPKYPDKAVDTISYLEAIRKLKNVGGGQVYPIDGSYGGPEKSIFVSNPSQEQKELVRRMSFNTGQESHIESTGKEHKMLHHHGEDAGKIKRGQGTIFHESKPNDFYSRMPDGTYFTHIFNDEFEKSEKNSTSLQKRSRPRIVFPNFPKVTTRPDQEVQPIQTTRQRDIYSRKAISPIFQEMTPVDFGLNPRKRKLFEEYYGDKAKDYLNKLKAGHEKAAKVARRLRPEDVGVGGQKLVASEKIPGGLAEGKTNKDFPKAKIAQGRKVEMEHTNDPKVAEEIARDHLTEDKNYYDKLKTIEAKKSEPLMKPYRSDAQRRWAHTPSGTKALGGKEAVKEWDKESKGKKLPEKIEKGARGDWQKEGYKLEHSHNPDINQHRILVHTPDRSEVAAHFIFEQVGNDWMPTSASVKKEHQRKGIASAAYKLFEEKTGNKLVPHKDRFGQDKRSDDAKKLWESRSGKLQKNQSNQPANVKINPEHGRILANVHEQAKHQPDHPETQKSYNALINETASQYKDLLSQGYKFSPLKPGQENPYKNSKDLHADLEQNKHLWYFPTEQGFGPEDKQNTDHPLFADSGFKDKHGNKMLHNDVFRIVHDINGHHLGGKTTFGPKGEHQAYLAHKKMYSSEAHPALAAETLLQNSAVNFGEHAEHNRKNPSKTIYAEQKAFAAPDWVVNTRWHE